MKHDQLQDTALRYFLAVVRAGSISEASARLNVAGSAISRQIAHLEQVLGTPLFERRARGMVASAAGEMLAAYAFRTELEADRLVQDIDALQGLRRGQVRIAMSEGFAIEFVPHAIADFRRTYPGIVFQAAVCAPADVTRRVKKGEADVGVTFSRTPESDIKVEHRQGAPVMAVMRGDHPLARFGQVSVLQMSAYPLALPDPSTTIRQLFDVVSSRQNLMIEPVMVSNNIVALHNFAIACDAISISGEVTVRSRQARGELAVRPIADSGMDARAVELQTLVGRTLPKVVQLFLEFLRARLAQGDDGNGNGADNCDAAFHR
ncbi:bacterial regulatory helix-turn-helix, lysR family protein [Burkholderia thailandensis MSMB121]|uniref:LysR family transcriptional regulator n=1 Tax=Burkholderia humptydooensis TaxID=430531 RepID=UPI000327FABB|nr:LysR family transcriptional regulator [Burkholderia humptydooensis]AGK49926.1 bacterial regulatory helix-turn-helix, lysR family protein [Burkholderia thailandensis MSMB121]ATF32575.1 LysR family transcriptional regulator [Burkholderia thailandensis]KST71238.1 LysR family transcriptional regulator [Burkholderia humptydooensis]